MVTGVWCTTDGEEITGMKTLTFSCVESACKAVESEYKCELICKSMAGYWALFKVKRQVPRKMKVKNGSGKKVDKTVEVMATVRLLLSLNEVSSSAASNQ